MVTKMPRGTTSIMGDAAAFDPSRKRWRDITMDGTTGTGTMAFLQTFTEAVSAARENGSTPPQLRVADRQGYEWRSEADEVFLIPGMLMFRYFHDLSETDGGAEGIIETVAISFGEISFLAFDEAIPSQEHLARRRGELPMVIPPEGVSNQEMMTRLREMRAQDTHEPSDDEVMERFRRIRRSGSQH